MTTHRLLSRSALPLALALALAACGPTGGHPSTPGAAPAHGPSKAESKTDQAIQALWRGDAARAEKLLRKALKKAPNDALARKLLQQITEDPRKLLGTESYAYRVKPGETLWGLAQRVLDDPMMFYALARYNDIAVPQTLVAGGTIRLPGKLKVEAPPPPKPVEKPSPPPAASPPPPPPPPAPPAVRRDPARAKRLRIAGLAAMNRGAIDRAVQLLQAAQTADPDNVLVTHDLERARRIQATVHHR